jgi:hypothetical protein
LLGEILDINIRSSSDFKSIQNFTTYETLLKEREKKKIEFIAADLAVKKYEQSIEAEKYDNLIKIENIGFTQVYRNISERAVPLSAITLARTNFDRELKNILKKFLERNNTVTANSTALAIISDLKLSNDGVWKREKLRKEIIAPWVIKLPYYLLCYLLDTLFDGRPINRFYFLETVARMPYFSYITMLHTYETLGWWRRSTEAKRVHFAEEYNEFHHLLIMESLGGDKDWEVRFLAQHSSIIYYFVLIFVWILSPTLAYNFSEVNYFYICIV